MPKFKKGQTGNAGGRPKANPAFKQRIKDMTVEALDAVQSMLRDKRNKGLRLKAAMYVIDQGEGKAVTSVSHSGGLAITNEYDKLSTTELLERAKEMGLGAGETKEPK